MASKLSLFLGNALRSAARSPRSSIRGPPMRTLCTETTATDDKALSNSETIDKEHSSASAAPSDGQDPSFDPFSHAPSKDRIFAKLTGTGRNALKTDIIQFFEGCNLTSEDIKVDYNKAYNPTGMIMRFPSRAAYDSAIRLISRNGRLYKLVKVDSNQWDLTESYNGKTVVLQGIPQNAVMEDIERFLHGCSYDGSNIRVFLRNYPDPSKAAVVNFTSQSEAMHAFRVKNHNFCLNSPVLVHILQ